MGILDLFKKRRPAEEFYGPPPGYPPYQEVPPTMPPIEAVRMGAPAPEMLDRMEAIGAPPPAIPPGMPPPPPPPARPLPEIAPRRQEPKRLLTEDIEAMVESVVSERWKMLTTELSEIRKWKIKSEKNITELKNKLKEIESKINSIEKSLLAKIEDYSKGVSDISAEIQAIQKVFRATMPEFTHRVKELSALVEKVKSKTPKRKITKKRKPVRKKK